MFISQNKYLYISFLYLTFLSMPHRGMDDIRYKKWYLGQRPAQS